MVNPYFKKYQQNYLQGEIETASPEKILILLYDGAIQFLNKAKIALEQNNNTEIYNNLIGAQKILLEFMRTIDMEAVDNDLPQRLYSLYYYLYKTLVRANIEKSMDKVNEVLNHMVELRATWKQAIAIAAKEGSLDNDGDEDNNE